MAGLVPESYTPTDPGGGSWPFLGQAYGTPQAPPASSSFGLNERSTTVPARVYQNVRVAQPYMTVAEDLARTILQQELVFPVSDTTADRSTLPNAIGIASLSSANLRLFDAQRSRSPPDWVKDAGTIMSHYRQPAVVTSLSGDAGDPDAQRRIKAATLTWFGDAQAINYWEYNYFGKKRYNYPGFPTPVNPGDGLWLVLTKWPVRDIIMGATARDYTRDDGFLTSDKRLSAANGYSNSELDRYQWTFVPYCAPARHRVPLDFWTGKDNEGKSFVGRLYYVGGFSHHLFGASSLSSATSARTPIHHAMTNQRIREFTQAIPNVDYYREGFTLNMPARLDHRTMPHPLEGLPIMHMALKMS